MQIIGSITKDANAPARPAAGSREFDQAADLVVSVSQEAAFKDAGESMRSITVILAQQEDGPRAPFGHKEAFEGGRQVGQIAVYVMIATIVIWGLFKFGAKLFKK